MIAMHDVFIAFEGGEGSGKSTLVQRVAVALREQGYEVITTREPGGTNLAEQLRGMILDSDEMIPRAELMMFLACRADHTERLIRPAMRAGSIVLCDRYEDSTAAYQGAARGHGIETVLEMSRWASGGLYPSLTILLDIDPEIGLARAQDGNRMEMETLEFHQRVNQVFRDIAEASPQTHRVIQANNSQDRVLVDTLEVVQEHLKQQLSQE